MANVTIGGLTAASSIGGTDLVEIEQGGASKKGTAAQLGDYVIARTDLAELIRDTIGTALVAGTNMTITVNDAGDTITLASSGGGGGGGNPVQHPGFRSGGTYRAGPVSTQNAALNNDFLQFYPLVLPETVTITQLALRVVTGVAGQDLKAAIYNNNDGYPTTKVAGSDVTLSLATSATNATATFGSPLALAAGVYWIAQATQATGATGVTPVNLGATEGYMGWLVGNFVSGGTVTAIGTQLAVQGGGYYALGMPTTAPAGLAVNNAAVPLLNFVVQ